MNKKIVMLTAYDYPTAKILDSVGVDIILVGDSLGNVVLGHQDTKKVTMQDMLHHTKAVAKGVSNAKIVADMPIYSYDTEENAIENAELLVNAGASAVKIEGRAEIVSALVKAGLSVMGHVGLLPQTAQSYKVQGKDEKSASEIFDDAVSISNAGAFAIVIECVPAELGKKITSSVNCPTIGIGAGSSCSGQVLVLHDMIGLSDGHPSFVKKYADVGSVISKAVSEFKNDVEEGRFP